MDISFLQQASTQIAFSIVLLIGGFIGVRILVHRVAILLPHVSGSQDKEGLKKRARTLVSLLTNVGYVVVLVVGGMMLLNAFGVDIRPLLAGAGIIGFAIGFGSQTLVKDLIAGVFILLENQFSVGDEVVLGTHTGRVLKITTRSTMLENKEGHILYLRNGDISVIENISQKRKDLNQKGI